MCREGAESSSANSASKGIRAVCRQRRQSGDVSEGAGMGKSGPRVGIDLEQSSIAGAQVNGSRQGHALTHAAVRSLPPGLMFEGEVVDVEGLAAELKSFWKASGFSGKRFALGVANQKVVVRTMDFPIMDEKELRAAIEFQAQEAIPIPLADAILDFEVLTTSSGPDGGGSQKVLIVAAQREMVEQFVEAARKAGLTIDGPRPAGVRPHAVDGSPGCVRRSGFAICRRGDGARQHELQHHQPRRGRQRSTPVHARREPRLRSAS